MNKPIDFLKKASLTFVLLLPVLSVLWLQYFDAKNWYILLSFVAVFAFMKVSVMYFKIYGGRFDSWTEHNYLAYASLSFALALAIFAGFVMTEIYVVLAGTILLCYEIWIVSQKQDDNSSTHKLWVKVMQTIFFAFLLLTVSSIITNFGQSQMFWASLLSLIFLSIAAIEKPEFIPFKFEYTKYDLFLLSVFILGLMSSIYQFKDYELFLGVNISQLWASLNVLLCLFLVFIVYLVKKRLNKIKKEAAEADKKIEKRRNRRIEVDI